MHRAPEPMRLALASDDNLVEMPLVSGCCSVTPDPGGKLVPEAANPVADRLVRHRDTAFRQKVFDIPQTQGEPMVGPNRVANNAPRKSETFNPAYIFKI